MGEIGDPERPGIGSDIFGHPLIPQTAVGTDPQDGMPRMTTMLTMGDSKAPELHPKSFVCMGDESVFVLRDLWGAVRLIFEPEEVQRSVALDEAEYFVQRTKITGAALSTLQIVESELESIGALSRSRTPWLKVEPIRPQCAHYRRVMTDFQGDPDHCAVERTCTAQRTEGGEYVSLGNTRILACEHRVPRDFVSEERLRKFDRVAVEAGERTEEEYDIEAALSGAGALENH